ncbi:MAG: glycosyltransferase family 2 protein [Bacteroidota bacterium]|nr:glycosyltransferase family 2 protein [Bacteroidota bacterium]
MQAIKVAVVILNWNGKHYLEKFLPAVISNSPTGSIFVVDNNSSDDSIEFLKNQFPEVSIVINKDNGGFAKGYNDGLQHIDAEYYILLNSDVEVTQGWIDPVIELMDGDKTIAACQPKILAFHNKQQFEYAGASGGFIDKYGYPFCRGRIFDVVEMDKGQYNTTREIFWATGACMFVRANVYQGLNGFDEDYFAHMEEIDLCWRMKNTGYRIYVVPSSTVFHVGGGTLNKVSPRKTYLNFRNNLITYTKNYSGPFLFMKVLYRIVLDGIAGAKFLLSGDGKHCWAVIKAHFAYYGSLGTTLRKRKALKRVADFKVSSAGILKGNIVALYFLGKKKRFSEIEHLIE